jgi:flavorubredoxin
MRRAPAKENFMKRKVSGSVSWVGKIDWELKRFHGSEYSTHHGSSYNSFVIEEEKTVLIDTVWMPFAKEFVDNLEAEGLLSKLDFIVQNHGEIDHSGALPELLRRRPDLPVYCTANAVKILKGHYHQDWNFRVVKSGDSVDIGNGKKLVFVEAPMLHWPDSMFTYLAGGAILFSNDAFGQHYASELLFNDLVDQDELQAESIKYYANILTPFSQLVLKKIDEVVGMNLPVDIIAPSHGILWRKDPLQIVQRYAAWAAAWKEDRVTVAYDSMWDGTRKLAESIAQGIVSASPSTTVVVHNVAKTDKNDVITDIFRSKAFLLGSPTVNKGVLNAVAGIMEEVKGLKFKDKKAASFGCYGWSGESPKLISGMLRDAGFEVTLDGFGCIWEPDRKALDAAFDYGVQFAKTL